MSSNLHGKKVFVNNSNYRQVLEKTIKTREYYLNDDEINMSANKIKRKDRMLIMFNDVNETPSFMEYKLHIHGIAPCGSKVTVIVEGIKPSVDIDYDNSLSKEENVKKVQTLLSNPYFGKILKGKSLDVDKLKLVEGKKLILFSEKNINFIRIYFNNLYHRNTFIKYLIKNDISSYNNDISSYYRVVSREFKIGLSGWNIIEKYRNDNSGMFKSRFVLAVNVKNITIYDETEHYEEFNWVDKNLLRKDKMISMAFDIEQYSNDFNINKPFRDTRLPSGKILEDVIFNIGLTYQFINNENSFLNIGLVTKDAKEHSDYLTIVCGDEKILLLVFGFLNGLIQPDFIVEFNGSQFDWPNIFDKCLLYGIVDKLCDYMSIKQLTDYEKKIDNIKKYIYCEDKIKISADRVDQKMANLRLQGYVAFDLRVVFMQLNPTESKSSLKFYLEMNNIQGKDDMPIPTLFKHYITGDYEGLGDVVHYCYVDCFRLHQLLYKNNIIQDRREVGLLSYTSMFDAFYRANGCKVRNLIIANALEMNLFFSNIKKDVLEEDKMDGKFPGAIVLDPKKKLITPLLTLEEFANENLDIWDKSLIDDVQKIINNNYDAVYIDKNINNVIM